MKRDASDCMVVDSCILVNFDERDSTPNGMFFGSETARRVKVRLFSLHVLCTVCEN